MTSGDQQLPASRHPAGSDDRHREVRELLGQLSPDGAPELPSDSLRSWGLASIGVTRLWFELHRRFGLDIPPAELVDADLPQLLAWVDDAAGGAVEPEPAAPASEDDRYQPFPLTPLQEAYLLAKQGNVDRAGCQLYREIELADASPDRLRQAWLDLIDHHDMLRAVITEDGSQRVRPSAPDWSMPVHDLARASMAEYKEHVTTVRDRLSRRVYEPGDWPLFEIEISLGPAGCVVVHLSLDTIVTDGLGYGLLLSQWWSRYHHPEQPLPAPTRSPRDCVLAVTGRRQPADVEYWVGKLAGAPAGPALVLPVREAAGDLARRPLEDRLSDREWEALRRRAMGLGISATSLVLTLFAEAVGNGRSEPFTLGITTSLRSQLPDGAPFTVAPLTSTGIFLVEDLLELPLEAAAAAVHRQLWADLRHSAVSGIEALRELRSRGLAGPPAPAVVFTSLLDLGIPTGVAGGFGSAIYYGVSQTTGVALDHQMWEQDCGLQWRWDVCPDRLGFGSAETAFARFGNALRAFAADDGQRRTVPLPELAQAYLVARSSGPVEGCQCYRSFQVEQLDVDRLGGAVLALLRRHAMLRAEVGRDGTLLVRSRVPEDWQVPVLELPDGDRGQLLDELRAELTTRPFPLERWPLLDIRITRDSAGSTLVHCAIDLLVGDAPAIHGLFRELWQLYAHPEEVPALAGAPSETPSMTAPDERDAAAAHWRARFAELPPGPPLAAPGGADRIRLSARLTGWRELRRRADEAGLRADDLLLAALTRALGHRFSDPFAVAVVRWPDPAHWRPVAERSELSWLAAAPAGSNLLDAAGQYRRQLAADEAASAVSGLSALRAAARAGAPDSYPVVYTGVVELTDEPLPAGVRQGEWLTSTPGCVLDAIGVAEGDELEVCWDITGPADPALTGLFDRYRQELAGLAAAATWQAGPPKLSAEERETVLYRWNDTVRPLVIDGPVHQRFESAAARRPDGIAVRTRTGLTTFRQLNQQANRIAWALRELGVSPGQLIGVRSLRGPDMIAAVYGVLKAGGAYLPLDPALPEARTLQILDSSEVRLVLSTSRTPGGRPGQDIRYLEIDTDPAVTGRTDGGRDPEPVVGPEDPAYVIFTSGSTGTPKGVAVAHRSVHNLLRFIDRCYGFTDGDVGLAVTSLSFDLSVFDVLGLLGGGAGIYLADEAEQRDPERLLEILLSEPVTMWNSAPTTLHQLSPLFGRCAGHPGAQSLRQVFLSGDFTPLSLPPALRTAFPGARLISLGGPTETTVWSNHYPVEEVDPTWRSIPYGRPIDNTRHYVLDEDLQPCPIGVEGELYTAGACLALGFWRQPDLTRERFVPDPFVGGAGERMYRTGDRALWLPDGNLSLVGRSDHQVKVRGYRIELGEIEHRLRQHPDVRDVVVLARDHAQERKLVAYVIPAAGRQPEARELRAHTAAALPDYMVPNFVCALDSFPATANGKLDRDALPFPLPAASAAGNAEPAAPTADPVGAPVESAARPAQLPSPAAEPAPAAPVAPAATSPAAGAGLAEEVAAIFAEVLGVSTVDPHGDVWDQGATSFTMVQVSARLKQSYGQRVPVSALISTPTPAGIAATLAAAGGAAIRHPEAPPTAPPPAAEPAVLPASQPSLPAAADGPGAVDLLSPQDRAAFKAAQWNLRQPGPDTVRVSLPEPGIDDQLYRWRAAQREYLGSPLPFEAFARLLGLLKQATLDGRTRLLYPSAGDTYAVQVYLHVRADAVAGLAEGIYYYHPAEHALHLVNPTPQIGRNTHFFYNRPVFDGSGFGIYLIGQTKGITPLYQEVAERFLMLEAGYIGQLLLLGQAACQVGLCPVGTISFEEIRQEFQLDDGHSFLHLLIGGRVDHPAPEAGGAWPLLATSEASADPDGAPSADGTAGSVDEPAAAGAPVAVVGMAGQFPGAGDPEELWNLLLAGRSSVAPAPVGRPELAAAGRPLGGYLPEVDGFESLLFRIAPTEAATLDPQLRLLLNTVWLCLEDAGYTAASLRAEAGRVGVFVGVMWQDYQQVGRDDWAQTGQARVSALASDIPNRISHVFDFTGPSLAVNTSCSSSLTALHLAVESLRRGECSAAIVGAVNLTTHPYHLELLQSHDLLSASGNRAAFAAEGSGWSPGEGVAALLLRPADVAGGAALGLIEATGVGHVGRSARFGDPDAGRLAASVRLVLEQGGLRPAGIDYVECAAAGAAVADAVELDALSEVFAGSGTLAGTLKPNIGHLESASGLSQLLKVLLQLRHDLIAPTRVARDSSALVDLADSPVRLVEAATPWPATDRHRRALVNSVGATGSYGHAVIREAVGQPGPAEDSGAERVVALSAGTPEQLRAVARRLRDHLLAGRAAGHAPALAEVSYTLLVGREPLAHRAAVLCRDLDELLAALDLVVTGAEGSRIAYGMAVPLAPSDADPVDAGSAPQAAAAAWVNGRPVRWNRVPGDGLRRVRLPGYPFADQPCRLPTAAGRVVTSSALGGAAPVPAVEDLARRSAAALHYLRRIYADVSGIPAEQLMAQVPLEHYGLSSSIIAQVNARLASDFSEPVSRTLFFEHRTLGEIAASLAERAEAPWPADVQPAADAQAATAVAVPVAAGRAAEPLPDPDRAAVAVIGIAGRYPDAPDLGSFWQNLRAGRDSVRQVPQERRRTGWPIELMWGGFLGEVAAFDPLFFGISPREARLMDPQERLFLEASWHALEDAGYPPSRLAERYAGRVGVFAGSMYNEYPFFGVELAAAGASADSGSALAGIANRVSYTFDLRGPSLAVDTMCSASLTALHLAVQSLQRGESRMAIAGGVNLSLHPHKYRQQARLRMSSSDHRCRSFGASGDGFVPGEGVGAVILKPLADAVADGDRIHAVIRGTAINHGGKTNGYMVPNPVAQAELIGEALDRGGVAPATVGYVEAHGTGTELGDPIEITGLARAFEAAGGDLPAGSVPIGSVKSNIGHLEAAAGIASVSKVILQLRHEELVPSLHAEELNPNVDWAHSPFRVQVEPARWPRRTGPDGDSLPRRAIVSSFGAGGANAHLVLEEPPQPAPSQPRPGRQLVVLSAYDEDRLAAVAGELRSALAEPATEPALADLAYTLRVGREALRERLALLVGSVEELREQLAVVAAGGQPAGAVRGRAPAGGLPGVPLRAGADTDLAELARHWTAGGAVDWSELNQGTRMVGLPGYPFRRDRYWLDESAAPTDAVAGSAAPAEQGDAAAGSAAPAEPAAGVAAPAGPLVEAAETPPIACYAKEWAPLSQPEPLPIAGTVVCLYHSGSQELATRLAQELGVSRVVLVAEADPSAGQPSAGLSYTGPEDAVTALDDVLRRHPDVTGWVDLCDLGREGDQPGPWLARVAMMRRVIAARAGAPLRVLQVVSGLQNLPGARPNLAGARLAGLVRALGAEYQQVLAIVLDTDADPGTWAGREAITGQVLSELGSDQDAAEVCYRDDHRLGPIWRPVTGGVGETPTLDGDACYVVSGGGRGIGAEIAHWLVGRGVRRLALLGSHRLPGRADWDDPDLAPEVAATVATIRRLEAAGAEVLHHGNPLGDEPALRAFLQWARVQLGPIGGVVHCAGRPSTGRPAFLHKTLSQWEQVSEPKVDGLLALERACAPDRPAFVLLASSISAAVPRLAAGVTEYAAANAFLDFYAGYQARSGRPEVRSVNWPTWAEVGMGANRPDPCAAIGVASLPTEAGLRLLGRVLGMTDHPQVLPCPPLGAGPDPATFGRTKVAPAVPVVPAVPADSGEPAEVPAVPVVPAGSNTQWLAQVFAGALEIPIERLDRTATFGDLGVESVMLGELVLAIEDRLGRAVEPAALLEYSTIELLAARLALLGPVPAAESGSPAAESGSPAAEYEPPATAPESLPAAPESPAAAELPMTEPEPSEPAPARSSGIELAGVPSGQIAVIGLDCRFPGAADPATFWANLVGGRCAVTEVPSDRWDAGALYRPAGGPGTSISKWGAFLPGIEDFDPDFFDMTEEEATCLDPAVRVILETAVGAVRDAGYREEELRGRDVGVFVGTRLGDYRARAGIRSGPAALGGDQNFAAARIAHHLDLHGPNLVIDTACSSALVAVQLACRSLLAGESELALVGGVDILLDERPYLEFTAARALSPRGRCATFDRAADGFVPGEGGAVVLLKPLARALADGDEIRAVIDAVAVNNDGRTMGLTTPNPLAQAAVVRRALAVAGRRADQVGLIEAHGTGTMIGDPIELRALTDVFREDSDRVGFCAVGSVKSNIGHLLSAAGMSGLVKIVLALQHRQLPPTLFCTEPNPRFDFAASPLYVNTSLGPWAPPAGGGSRVAGVSAFGLGGTNAHLIASELDPALARGRVPRRSPLPAPAFRRRRLWLERPDRPVPKPPAPRLLTSLLDLDFAATGPSAGLNGASKEIHP